MSRRQKSTLTVVLLLALGGFLSVVLTRLGGTEGAPAIAPQEVVEAGLMGEAEALSDVGVFRRGYEESKLRAGFSGRPLLRVYFSRSSRELRALREILQEPRVQELAGRFTPAWVEISDIPDRASDRPPEAELPLIAVHDIHGRCLGVLSGERLTSENLLEMLEALPRTWPKSPLYQRLLESTEPLDFMASRGDLDRARFTVQVLRELEAETPAVVQAEARIAALDAERRN